MAREFNADELLHSVKDERLHLSFNCRNRWTTVSVIRQAGEAGENVAQFLYQGEAVDFAKLLIEKMDRYCQEFEAVYVVD